MFNFDFLEKGQGKWFLHRIFCIIFQEKCFLGNILLTDPISLSDYLYFFNKVLVSPHPSPPLPPVTPYLREGVQKLWEWRILPEWYM